MKRSHDGGVQAEPEDRTMISVRKQSSERRRRKKTYTNNATILDVGVEFTWLLLRHRAD
jgi:hypothetical protein